MFEIELAIHRKKNFGMKDFYASRSIKKETNRFLEVPLDMSLLSNAHASPGNPLDYRPTITFENREKLLIASEKSFEDLTRTMDCDTTDVTCLAEIWKLESYGDFIHEALHLGDAYGYMAQNQQGEWHFYGGKGWLYHASQALLEKILMSHDLRPSEQVENAWTFTLRDSLEPNMNLSP